jgi:hypothetical protein
MEGITMRNAKSMKPAARARRKPETDEPEPAPTSTSGTSGSGESEGDKAERRGAKDYQRAANSPSPTAAHDEKKELMPTERRKERAKLLQEFATIFDSIDDHTLLCIEAVLLIQRRDRGCNTPVEEFIDSLLLTYMLRDDDGVGMTLEDVEHYVEQLRDNYESAVRDAFFVADRYPRLQEPVEA